MKLLIDSPRYENSILAGYFLKKCDENKQHSGKYYTVNQYNALCDVIPETVKSELPVDYKPEVSQSIEEPAKRGRPRK